VPQIIHGLIKCPNDKCITNQEREPVASEFNLISQDPLKISCVYCERILSREDIFELWEDILELWDESIGK